MLLPACYRLGDFVYNNLKQEDICQSIYYFTLLPESSYFKTQIIPKILGEMFVYIHACNVTYDMKNKSGGESVSSHAHKRFTPQAHHFPNGVALK